MNSNSDWDALNYDLGNQVTRNYLVDAWWTLLFSSRVFEMDVTMILDPYLDVYRASVSSSALTGAIVIVGSCRTSLQTLPEISAPPARERGTLGDKASGPTGVPIPKV